MKQSKRYSSEVRERAVRMVFEHQADYASQWAAIGSIAGKFGCTLETLRNWGGAVLDQVSRGETPTVTRNGKPVAELRPLDRTPLSAEILVSRWQRLPRVDADTLKADIEAESFPIQR